MDIQKSPRGVEAVCLEVYGMLSASVTHEIKNTLSIINENAGLIQDLCAMVEGDDGVPAGRVDASMQMIANQVNRSNVIMKNLNRFSHSNDRIPDQADLSETVTLLVALTSRFAAMRKVSVTTDCESGHVITTNVLTLYCLVFLILKTLYSLCLEDTTLLVSGKQAAGLLELRFVPEKTSSQPYLPDFPGEKEKMLANYIGATCTCENGEIVVLLKERG
jgi:phosphoglycerate-specific signal transduction histidine kinase